MGVKNAPAPPNYAAAAEATADSSRQVTRDQTFANRPSQNTPWGRNTWTPGSTIDPSTGEAVTTWESNLTLSPAEQASLESQQNVQLGRSQLAEGIIGRTGDELNDPFDWDSIPGLGSAPDAGGAVRNYDMSGAPQLANTDFSSLGTPENVDYGALPGLDASGGYNPNFAQTAYDRSASLLEPRNERSRAAMDNRLRNQGLVPGTEAYDNAMGDLMDQQGETMSRLAQDSVFAGADLQDRQFGREATTRGIYGDEAQQSFGNDAYIRNLMSGDMQQQFENSAVGRDIYGNEMQAGIASDLASNQQQFGQQLQAGGFQNALRQQAISEEAQRRGMSVNEMNALLTGQQVGTPQMPNFMGANAASPTDYLRGAEAQGQFDQQTYNTALGPLNALLGNQSISSG